MKSGVSGMSQAKQAVLEATVAELKNASNVVAVVLGGSHARGVARESSDLDLGIYYREEAPLVIEEIRAAAASISAAGTVPMVTDLYGWGPWVNGGAWIQTPATKVDFVYRNLDQVDSVIEEGLRGIWRHDYDQQPPFGFRSVTYFAETHFCVPLHDPWGEIARLKQAVAVYPGPLKARILQDGLWGAEFSLWSGEGFAASGDVLNTAGSLARASHYLTHAMFALNEEYLLNDKHVNRLLNGFSKVPHGCAERLAEILSRPGRSPEELRAALDSLRGLWAEAVELTAGAYQARFNLAAARNKAGD
ncbi:MAG: nucleotidyltransferase domain-containing protein [Acidobacteria bacterium]|nr:nucleotidyltransferase domain-containing protein [Acidobacteriota bacterium]